MVKIRDDIEKQNEKIDELNIKIGNIKKKNDILKNEINDLVEEQNNLLNIMKVLSLKINNIFKLIEKIAEKEGKQI